ncbi:MAG TPA: NAD-glutamate dehydrogenase [Gammaproteobacteria bacterium]
MSRKRQASRNGLVDAIVRSSRGIAVDSRLPGTRAELLRAYFADVPEQDVQDRDLHDLAAAALRHIESSRVRRPDASLVRVFNPSVEHDGWSSDTTVVELVNEDMPFLVDSVSMALNRLGYGVRSLIHPILGATRSRKGELEALAELQGNGELNAESYILIETSRIADSTLLRDLERTLRSVLRDVRAAVEDWQPMLAELRATSVELRTNAQARPELVDESSQFIEWLAKDNFTLLGYREYRLSRGKRADRLRPIAGTGLGISRDIPGETVPTITLNPQASRIGRTSTPLVITKTDAMSTIHRSGHLDLVGVKIFGTDGEPRTVKRFTGLFTSTAYNERPSDIPLVRMKIAKVMRRSSLDPASHSGKALQHILNTFPRDDLFQGSTDDLARISSGILGLQERQRVRLFCRRDAFSRFYSCFVYLPREQYSAATRKRIEKELMAAFGGTSIESRLTMSESALARIEATIRIPAEQKEAPKIAAIEARLEKVAQTWRDRLRGALLDRFGNNEGMRLYQRFGDQFPAAYEEQVHPTKAAGEIDKLESVIEGRSALEMSLRRSSRIRSHALCFTTIQRDDPIELYTALPILEGMGTKVRSERLYPIRCGEVQVWVQEFEIEPTNRELDSDAIEIRFRECFRRVLLGDAENDQFNSFVIDADLDWRAAALLRGYCKYLLQTGLAFSQSYMQEVLSRYPILTQSLVGLFRGYFDPAIPEERRKSVINRHRRTISNRLDRVETLDEDRIVRAFISVVEATLRTNFFQSTPDVEKPFISFKLDSAIVAELPAPRPKYEIFVYSPKFEGVHLRCGSIARGGLRWSDRREDFRTEILGLMKAQQVKNTVIVPAGAKGGFVCKQLPADGDERLQQAIDCYKNFIRGMLDITDNIVGNRIVTPDGVVRRDGDDPYLVVAADKGTATFSDHANGVASEYEFWLGDAFASGGSAGYDHKAMGITARGAWECVKRHFRELGIDTQKQAFTAVGVGDMSGDVFGNGMLMSRHLRLVAAFNHRHIFIDPNPDAEDGYRERRRLFRKGSGWEAYDESRLSEGGGIFSRTSKTVDLSAAARQVLGLGGGNLTPPDVIRAILRSNVDLLWSGGIGTYVKSSKEPNANVRDPGNDAVRIDASELRCKVIGEGGNLVITQLGRIEFASRGGGVNTDFIDNSGGVDTSDHEVNVKILLERAIASGSLTRPKRESLLAEMTDEIAELVLENNYQQSQTLSVASAKSQERLGEDVRMIRALEVRGLISRELEFLPTEEEIAERRKEARGLTRPELAVTMSYAKIDCYDGLIDSDLPEDPFFLAELEGYFPARLRRRFGSAIREHRLRREIIAMRMTNDIVNRMGASFMLRAKEDVSATTAQLARAYAVAREIFGVGDLCEKIEARDYQAPAAAQYELLFQIGRRLRHAIYWLLQRYPNVESVDAMVRRFAPGVTQVEKALASISGAVPDRRTGRSQLERFRFPGALAKPLEVLAAAPQVLDIIEIAEDCNVGKAQVAAVYFELGQRLRLGWIQEKIESLRVEGRWPATARTTLREHLTRQQYRLVRAILKRRGARSPSAALKAWLDNSATAIDHALQNLKDMESSGVFDFATLSVAIREIERLG